MPSVAKVSISLGAEDLRWARDRAKSEGIPLSAVISEAVRVQRQNAARARYIKASGHTFTREELDALEREWTR